MIASTMKFHCASEGLSKKEDLMMDLKPLLVNALLYSFAVDDFTVNIDNQRELDYTRGQPVILPKSSPITTQYCILTH